MKKITQVHMFTKKTCNSVSKTCMLTLYVVHKETLVIWMYIQLRRYWTQFSSMRSVEVSRGEWKFLLLCILKYWYLIIQNNGKTLRLYHGTRHRGSEIEDNSSVDRVYTVYNTCACWWTCSKGGLKARAST